VADENRERNERLAQRAGFANYQQYQDALEDENFKPYRYWLRRAAENLSADTGVDYHHAWQQVRKLDSAFHLWYGRASRSKFSVGDPTSEGKAMHKLLVYLRLRYEQEWWGVGDTPDLG
jgi:hypothetical protein